MDKGQAYRLQLEINSVRRQLTSCYKELASLRKENASFRAQNAKLTRRIADLTGQSSPPEAAVAEPRVPRLCCRTTASMYTAAAA